MSYNLKFFLAFSVPTFVVMLLLFLAASFLPEPEDKSKKESRSIRQIVLDLEIRLSQLEKESFENHQKFLEYRDCIAKSDYKDLRRCGW